MPAARRPVTLIALLCVLALTATAAAGPADGAVAKGTIRGTVPKAPAGKLFPPTVRVYQLAPVIAAVRVPVAANGRFSVRATPGLYGLVISGWVAGRPKTAVRVVRVTRGATARIPTVKALARTAAEPIPRIRLSVGSIRPTDPSLAYLTPGLASLGIADAPFTRFAKCKMGLYEDRKHGRYGDILREIALGKSRFADPSFRAMAHAAERNLKRHTPTVRLNGTVDTVDPVNDNFAAGTFRLVDLKTGKVIWSERVTSKALFDLPGAAVRAAVARLCDPNPFPATYSGTISQNETAFGLTTLDWSGSFTYTRTNSQVNPDGSRNALYALTGASVTKFDESGICTTSTSSPNPTIRFGDLEIDVTPSGAWTYGIQADTKLPDTTHSCPPGGSAPFTPIAFFNSRSVTGGLAPMTPAGAITGGGPLTVPFTTGTASWTLAPGA